MIDNCPVCETLLADPFFELNQVPIFCNIQYSDPSAARKARRGDIQLALCPECHLIINRNFNPSLLQYDLSYENALHFSPAFREYLEQLAIRLTYRFSLQDKLIIEVGAGDGYFLHLLCDNGVNRGVGFDPAHLPSDANEIMDCVRIYQGQYDLEKIEEPGDLIICRHLLEHIHSPLSFLRSLTRDSVLKACGGLYLEVPNAGYIIENLSIWDIIYEHCLYFSATSLSRLLRNANAGNFILRKSFGEQFLSVEVDRTLSSSVQPAQYDEDLRLLSEKFSSSWLKNLPALQEKLDHLSRNGRRIAIWGAGSKGVTFNNTVGNVTAIKAFIDINVRKQHRFAPGTGLPILPPEHISKLGIDTVLIMNSNYRREIERALFELGVKIDSIVI